MKKYDYGLSAVFGLLGAAVIYFAKDLKQEKYGLGAGDWPRFLGIILIVLAVLLLVQTLIKGKKNPESREKKPPFDFRSAGMKRVYKMIGILTLFCLLLKFVGFYLGCVVLLLPTMVIFGEKRPLVLLAVTGSVTLSIFIIFGMILHTPLPQGTIFM